MNATGCVHAQDVGHVNRAKDYALSVVDARLVAALYAPNAGYVARAKMTSYIARNAALAGVA